MQIGLDFILYFYSLLVFVKPNNRLDIGPKTNIIYVLYIYLYYNNLTKQNKTWIKPSEQARDSEKKKWDTVNESKIMDCMPKFFVKIKWSQLFDRLLLLMLMLLFLQLICACGHEIFFFFLLLRGQKIIESWNISLHCLWQSEMQRKRVHQMHTKHTHTHRGKGFF